MVSSLSGLLRRGVITLKNVECSVCESPAAALKILEAVCKKLFDM